jgi:dipeptidyl aminopeptidase/acylaminoacyl peptidase
MYRNVCRQLACLLLVFGTNAAIAADAAPAKAPTLADLIRKWQVRDAKLSPGGDYLAVTLPTKDDKIILGILPIANPQALQTVGVSGPGEMVDRFEWVSPQRLVMTIAKQVGGAQLAPFSTGEVWAVNADGSRLVVLNSWRGEIKGDSRLNKNTSQQTFAFVLDTLPADDENILMYTTPIESGDDGAFSTIYRVDVNSGARVRLGNGPIRNADFLVDQKGQVRVAYGIDTNRRTKIYTRPSNDDEWKLTLDEATEGLASMPIGFAGDDEHIYIQREESKGPDALYRLSLKDGSRNQILRHPLSDPLRYYHTADGMDVYGALFDGGTQTVETFGDTSERSLLTVLAKEFQGSLVQLLNLSSDGKYALMSVSDSTNPGDFYRVDLSSDTKKVEYLISRGRWLDSRQLAAKRPISFKARDGMALNGYLTLPRGSEGKQVPMVVWIHGGPHGPRDYAGYDAEVQMFATRGFAVLQVNYRGSGGYGGAFLNAGYGRWGTEMQDDVTDATQWAIKSGIADAKRICIGGASYGGYAAMMGAAREPDLYRCAISYVGVHDLRMMFTRGDIPDSSYGESYLKEALGDDMDALYQRSPVSQAHKIKAAVFIAAGGQDKRVPVAHAKTMKAALDKAGHKSYEYRVEPREGHGYYDPEHQLELYTGMLEFLDKYIGTRSTTPGK